jgi:2-polyprenyl-6-methoxyphenol hydroxylase-like FAD-dependent oxidoreductase
VGIASCGKMSSAARTKSIFLWTHIHMSEKDARMATRASIEAELARRSASWSPELRAKYDLYGNDEAASLAFGPVYNGRPPPNWYGSKMILCGDAAHPYGPGGQGISMALKDAKALSEVIARGFNEDDKEEFQRSRARESRTLGEAAEKRNAKDQSSTRLGVFAEGVLMKTVEVFTRGKLRF